MERYNQPKKGAVNWHRPLNHNFADLGLEVTNEVATFSDLPDPTGETSSNGIPRTYLVRESRVVYRDGGGSWEVVAGLGSEGSPVPGTSHFERVRADTFYTVEGTAVGDIAEAVANNPYVRLQPGVTYTHDGSSRITHGRGNGDTVVDARGASIQVRGTVVDVDETSENGDWFHWYGGRFEGSNAAGEVAFDVSDSVFNVFEPAEIRNCEVGMAFFNEDLWCEYNTISFRGHENDATLVLIGNSGSPPPGSSLRDPAQNGGTDSFRNFDIDLNPSPRTEVLSTCYGIYTSDCKPYTSTWNVTVSGDEDCVGWRIGGNLNGSWFFYHYETPTGRSGGTGIRVDRMQRGPAQMMARISGSADTAVVNNTTNPLMYWDCALTDGGDVFGWRRMIDGEAYGTWTRTDGTPYRFDTGRRTRYRNTGARTDPVIEIGTGGAGLFVDDDGRVVAVDESGNTNSLT
jgi:hypothetical protein